MARAKHNGEIVAIVRTSSDSIGRDESFSGRIVFTAHITRQVAHDEPLFSYQLDHDDPVRALANIRIESVLTSNGLEYADAYLDAIRPRLLEVAEAAKILRRIYNAATKLQTQHGAPGDVVEGLIRLCQAARATTILYQNASHTDVTGNVWQRLDWQHARHVLGEVVSNHAESSLVAA